MTGSTIEICLAEASRRLKAAGVANPAAEARLLLSHVLDVDQSTVIGHPERPVRDQAGFLSLVGKRARGMPMSHLLGRREFWSLDFRVTPDTLDPRPDSETLVEAAMAAVAARRGKPLSVLDLGTGTGCLLLALLTELPEAWGVGSDLSPRAVAVAHDNARRLQLDRRAWFLVADWGAALSGRFDLVVANPPYIPSADIDRLQTEVAAYEPRLALDGGADGLQSYRALMAEIKRLLAPCGTAVIEVGDGQWDAVASLFTGAEMSVVGGFEDLSGVRRCVVLRHAEAH